MELSRTEVDVDSDIYELVPGFCKSRQKDLQNLNTFVSSDDFNSIAKVSHTIKGIARPYGFPTLETLVIQLEKAAKDQDKKKCAEVIAQMDSYFSGYCS